MINGKRVVATISARMGSTRLPGKVLMPILGKSVIEHMVDRLRHSNYFDDIIIATTTDPKDDVIEKLCVEKGYLCHRGSENDLLSRVYDAAKKCNADIVFRGMADSPVVDWRIVDQLIEELEKGGYDYASNEIEEPIFPVGFDASVFPMKVLEEVHRIAKEETYREHVTLYIYKHPEKYKLFGWKAEGEMLWPELRLTLDTPEDFKLISIVYENLYPVNPDFSALDIVRFLRKNQDLVLINTHVQQRKPTLP